MYVRTPRRFLIGVLVRPTGGGFRCFQYLPAAQNRCVCKHSYVRALPSQDCTGKILEYHARLVASQPFHCELCSKLPVHFLPR